MNTQLLPVRLNIEEKSLKLEELGKTLDELERLEASKKVSQAGFDAKIKELKSEVAALGRIARDGEERREVEVIEQMHFSRGLVEIVRQDTFETVMTRPMTLAERQKELSFDLQANKRPEDESNDQV